LKDPAAAAPAVDANRRHGPRVLHRDPGLALLSACSAAGATLLGCLVWIQGSWPEGAAAAQFAAIGCCLFATLDNPAKVVGSAIIGILVSLPLGALYVFAIFPRIDGFASLALVLTPMLMVFSLMQTSEKLEGPALVLAIGFSGSLALQTTYRADFAAFVNSNAALVAGLLLALFTNLIFRTVEPLWNALRISRAGWRSVGRLARARRPIDLQAWTVQMLDRMGLVLQRIRGTQGADMAVHRIDSLRDMRVGLNVATIKEVAALQDVSELVARTYDAWINDAMAPAPEATAHAIDAGIDELAAQPVSVQQARGLAALTSLRLDLAPRIAPYLHVPAPT
jgi:uncharacterized membrane protein YccC